MSATRKVEIYTKATCPYCHRAKALLDSKGISYIEHSLTLRPWRKGEMIARAQGRHTVPQIFIDDIGYGGCDELYKLEAAGELNILLGLKI